MLVPQPAPLIQLLQPAQGVSAVKAIQIAAAQGQRVYHITPANQTTILPNLHLDALAMDEIRQALATGKEVITHTDRISVPGFTGEGYILFDPVSGHGAYKIGGGGNGGWYTLVAAGGALMFGVLLPLITAFSLFLVLLLIAVTVVAITLAMIHGVDFEAFWSEIEYMGNIATATFIMVQLAKVAIFLGAPAVVPWLLAALIVYAIVFGILQLTGGAPESSGVRGVSR